MKDRIKNNILPLCLDVCSIALNNKNNLYYISVLIKSGLRKPYYIKKYGMSPRGCYKRIASSSEPMTDTEIEEMFSRRVRSSLKNIISPIQELTFNQLKIYYEGKGKILNDNFLQSLNLLTSDGKINYAGYILADENSISIKVGKYSGTTRVDLIGNDEYGYCSLLKAYDRLNDRLIAENTTFAKITPKERLERKLIDAAALREAVLNAILHNDYANFPSPKIEFFSDRVEITSMGGLPLGMTIDNFFSGMSIPRNNELMRVFRDIDFVEQLGSGVPRILEAYSRDVFTVSDNYIRVT
ncbi:MAG: ATP-binding protein, partial [Methanocorpusculum sp.]|nr:ATP-binding protein [Methanocorpusculum sp.]